jgi:hypothetical protein
MPKFNSRKIPKFIKILFTIIHYSIYLITIDHCSPNARTIIIQLSFVDILLKFRYFKPENPFWNDQRWYGMIPVHNYEKYTIVPY